MPTTRVDIDISTLIGCPLINIEDEEQKSMGLIKTIGRGDGGEISYTTTISDTKRIVCTKDQRIENGYLTCCNGSHRIYLTSLKGTCICCINMCKMDRICPFYREMEVGV